MSTRLRRIYQSPERACWWAISLSRVALGYDLDSHRSERTLTIYVGPLSLVAWWMR